MNSYLICGAGLYSGGVPLVSTHLRKFPMVVLDYLTETNICSIDATNQTIGSLNAFMLVFNDPTAASITYEQFQEDGITPTHGRGPWVVFVGHWLGVFTSL